MTDPHSTDEPETAEEVAEPQVNDLGAYDSGGYDDLDARYREERKPPYQFTWDGHRWELPHMMGLDWRLIEKIEELAGTDEQSAEDNPHGVVDDIKEILRRSLGGQWEAFEETPQPIDKLLMLFNRWRDHSGMAPGEDDSSADSSNGTAGRSKQTSATTARGSGSKRPSSAGQKKGSRRGKS